MFPDLSGWKPSNERIAARFDSACLHLGTMPGNRFWTRELIAAFNAAERRGMIEPAVEHITFDECTCLPLDGGLGAQTCQACKRMAGNNEIEF